MRKSNLKLAITAAVLAGTIGTFSAFAHEGEGKGMMFSDGMQGMGGMMEMMNMMSDMAPEDRKAMMGACMNMMQSHDSHMGADKSENSDGQ
ncbi:hypothetical protein [Marinobacter sp.]|uniref:hypothetical protein n=1 Tax=Marinobacter sp. TaxID=50741 RepID=UPI00384E987F